MITEGPDNYQYQEQMKCVDQLFTHYDRPCTPGIVVGISRHGELVHAQGYGRANVEYDIQLKPETPIRMASVTKQFTAALMLILEDEGLLNLSDDIRVYLPEVPDYGNIVTIDHMLTNRSGLRWDEGLSFLGGRQLESPGTLDYLYRIVHRQAMCDALPGVFYAYNDSGFRLALRIAEIVTRQSFEEAAIERIFKPLGMAETSFVRHPQTIVPGLAATYAIDQDGGIKRYFGNMEVSGDGAMVSNLFDLLTWGENLLAPRIGGTEFAARMIDRPKLGDNRMCNYTRGLVVGSHRGEDYFGHTGGYYAYTGLYVFPSYDLVIAFASNRDDVAPAETALRIFDALYPDHLVKTPDPLLSFVDGTDTGPLNGIYVNPDAGLVFNATSRDSVIRLNHGGRGAYLSPVGNNTFIAGPGAHSAKLIINNNTAEVSADLYDGNMRTFHPVLPQSAYCKEFAALIGVYYSAETGAALEISDIDNQLIMHIANHPTPDFEIKLMRLLPRVLMANDMSLIFESLNDAHIQGFTLHAHGTHNISYRRIG